MTSIIFKIISAIVTLFIIIVSYGVISWNVFGIPTFMSGGAGCTQTVYTQISSTLSESKPASSFFRDNSMFGNSCTTK